MLPFQDSSHHQEIRLKKHKMFKYVEDPYFHPYPYMVSEWHKNNTYKPYSETP